MSRLLASTFSFSLVVLLAASLSTSRVNAQPTSGRMVAVGTRTLWIACSGTGGPTVILEAGHTESSGTWDRVQPRVATATRVCSYDRAGRGRSGALAATDSSRTAYDVARDLAALLDGAGERGPFVLVGHSLGGIFVRRFALAQPGAVAGMVLLDAVHEREFEAVDSLRTAEQRAAGAGMSPMSPEGLDISRLLREVRADARPMPWPLVVVARGQPLRADEFPPSWTPSQRLRLDALRATLQRELVALSPRGRLVIATRSGHHVHHDEPELVVQAILDVVEQHRRASRPGTGAGSPRSDR